MNKEEFKGLFDKILKDEIGELEKEINKLQSSLSKVLNGFNPKNIDKKVNSLSTQINSKNDMIWKLYELIGGVGERIDKVTK